MSYNVNDKVYRNLPEQVLKNTQDLESFKAGELTLANFGIKIRGTVTTEDDLPDPLTYQSLGGEFGDAYLVGPSTQDYKDYYIFTRPDTNAGQTDPYWLNIGEFPRKGDTGAQGATGAQGEAGHSPVFQKSNQQIRPSSVEIASSNEGDVFITTNGNVYRVQEYQGLKSVVYITNIMGPRGVTGAQGPQGPQGPQGERGQDGAQGQPGKSIYLYGQVDNASQLPSPEVLQDMDKAYLVGTTKPYDVYAQVGEDISSAVWTNIGTFQVGTQVTVNGQGVATFDADNKLDKLTITSDYYRVYTVNPMGDQGIELLDSEATNWSVAKRTFDGCLKGKQPNTWTNDHLVNWGALNANFYDTDTTDALIDAVAQAKLDKVSTVSSYQQIYGKTSAGDQVMFNATYENYASTIPSRNTSGNIQVGTATSNQDATNKQYVDGRVVANPSTTGTTDLTSLTVGDTTYNIPSGGGSQKYLHNIIITNNFGASNNVIGCAFMTIINNIDIELTSEYLKTVFLDRYVNYNGYFNYNGYKAPSYVKITSTGFYAYDYSNNVAMTANWWNGTSSTFKGLVVSDFVTEI